jgi:hypothetical protein
MRPTLFHGLVRLLLALCLAAGASAHALTPADALALVDGDTAAVVAAVLEPLQALDEDGNDVAGTDRADDAAHGEPLESGKRRW